MRINHNIAALNTHRQLNSANNAQSSSMEKLSSGLRINRAGDDAAGLAISEKMRGQIRGLETGSKNAQDGISMIQTAEGGLNEVHDILQRMRELAVQSSNDTNVTEDRTALDNEFQQLAEEVTRIKEKSQFNKQNLFDKTAGDAGDGKVNLQVGANNADLIQIDFATAGVELESVETALGTLDITDYTNSQAALTALDTQIESVSSGRSYLGAMQNRLEHTINNLNNASENLTAAESRIRDVDYAIAA
ncbi:flagellin [Bacillus sp. FJAT-18017]|uniref:flagellin N-terminal helical domain-containing protein n=1 Tax=Bacillus sp. FJAT-18017 TaxID=1705566 RepID=UPI0006B064D1|nr:flagellin [Bacillus sp. FJAT-18017]ALC92267.1 flagellin [Bacillus sp. FJAT-18017]